MHIPCLGYMQPSSDTAHRRTVGAGSALLFALLRMVGGRQAAHMASHARHTAVNYGRAIYDVLENLHK